MHYMLIKMVDGTVCTKTEMIDAGESMRIKLGT